VKTTYRIVTDGHGLFRVQFRTWPGWTISRVNSSGWFTSLEDATRALENIATRGNPSKWVEVYRRKV